jgi:hypothetical protein
LCNLSDISHEILINDFDINPLQDKCDEKIDLKNGYEK